MNTPVTDLDVDLAAGIAAARAGERDQARTHLLRVLQADPGRETAWFWLSKVMPTTEQALRCIDHLLMLNPTHAQAREVQGVLRIQLLLEEAPQGKEPPPPSPTPPLQPLLGRVLVELGLLTSQQLEQVLEEQARLHTKRRPANLGEILVRRKLVKREQLEAVLAVQRDLAIVPGQDQQIAPDSFGEFLMQCGLVTRAQVAYGRLQQAALQRHGRQLPLGEVLVQLRYLPRWQLQQALLEFEQHYSNAAATEQKGTSPGLPAHDAIEIDCSTLLTDPGRKLPEVEHAALIQREMEVRAQIGRDLHDGPVQQIAAVHVAVQHARRVAQHMPERLPEILEDLQTQLKHIAHDLRTVLYELRPLGLAEEGLVSVLQQYVERFRDPNGMRLHLDAPPHLRRLNLDREAAIFIIVQEAVNNARKHAAARDIWIKLDEDNQALYVKVHDNGRGFDLQAVETNYTRRGSYGLLNMRERAQFIGGHCTLRSEPGQGTTIEIRIPFSV